ncbi:hypothetical protein ABZ700_04645 [Streptomyces diastaticus]|uniref:hypothetical protein n=1 Tax=Streptomyces diastaticus TaxID=1956 RepID=UPI0034104937
MPVGCGRHTARVVDRNGALVAQADVLTSVEWTRLLDDTSTASVVIQPERDCCEALSRVRSWRHDLQIFRDGQGVWEGPIVTPTWRLGAVEIQAVDVLGWLDRRVPHDDMVFPDTDLVHVAAALIRDGFAPHDPGHLVQILDESGIRGLRRYERDVGQTGDHLRALAETGLDYTAVGRRILLMGEDHCERVGTLTDADFPAGLEVSEDGASLATRWVLHGAEEGDIKGEAGGIDPYYGLLERVSEETSVLDNGSAAAGARSRLRGAFPAPTFIDTSSETTLSPDASVDVPSLVPGYCVDVTTTTTCRTIAQSLKVYGVKVTESGQGESVRVQLVPAGV